MSPRRSDSSSPSGGPYRKPRPGIYTMMLLVALLCLIIGTVFLYLETKDYGPNPFSGVLPSGSTGGGTAVSNQLSAASYQLSSLSSESKQAVA